MNKRNTHPFGSLAKRYRQMRSKLPLEVSNIALTDFFKNFKRQGYVNAHGVFIPWRRTKKKAGKVFGGLGNKGILIGRGRLSRSMRTAPVFNEARVVSNLPYAAAHNDGVKKRVNVRSHKRGNYALKRENFKTRAGKTKSKAVWAKKGDSVVKGHKRNMNLARRPFMITSKPLMDDIEKHAFKEIDKIWNQL